MREQEQLKVNQLTEQKRLKVGKEDAISIKLNQNITEQQLKSLIGSKILINATEIENDFLGLEIHLPEGYFTVTKISRSHLREQTLKRTPVNMKINLRTISLEMKGLTRDPQKLARNGIRVTIDKFFEKTFRADIYYPFEFKMDFEQHNPKHPVKVDENNKHTPISDEMLNLITGKTQVMVFNPKEHFINWPWLTWHHITSKRKNP